MILDTQNFILLGAYPLNKQDMSFSWENFYKVGGQ